MRGSEVCEREHPMASFVSGDTDATPNPALVIAATVVRHGKKTLSRSLMT